MLNLILKLPRRVLCVMTVVGIEIVRERRWRATVPVVLQYRGNCSQDEGCEGERVALGFWALGMPAAGLRPRPTTGKGFPSNLLLD